MRNSSSHNNNRKTITTNLKDGTPITLREYDRFTVRGEVAYSHFLSPLSPKQIERKNERRDEWAKSEDHVGPYYHDELFADAENNSLSDEPLVLKPLEDVIKHMIDKVDTYCVGVSASMAAVIFSCGGSGKRYIFPNGKLMIHDPLIHQTGGNALQLKAISDSLLEYRETIGKLLAKNTGKTLEEIYELTKQDTYMNAEECIRNHFADFIVGKE